MYVYSQNDSDQEHNVYHVNNDFDLIILNHTQFFKGKYIGIRVPLSLKRVKEYVLRKSYLDILLL